MFILLRPCAKPRRIRRLNDFLLREKILGVKSRRSRTRRRGDVNHNNRCVSAHPRKCFCPTVTSHYSREKRLGAGPRVPKRVPGRSARKKSELRARSENDNVRVRVMSDVKELLPRRRR